MSILKVNCTYTIIANIRVHVQLPTCNCKCTTFVKDRRLARSEAMMSLRKYGFVMFTSLGCVVILLELFLSFGLRSEELDRTPLLNTSIPRNLQTFLSSLKGDQDTTIVEIVASPSNISGSATPPKSFLRFLQSFPWRDFENAEMDNNTHKRSDYSHQFITGLLHWLVMEPRIPVNNTCHAQALPNATEIDCAAWPNAFGWPAIKRGKAVKIGVLLQFGFDVDVLEIHLNEMKDIVDQFFIIESTHAHYGNVPKPLVWEHVQVQDRFKMFPVTHFIIDNAESAHVADSMWAMESLQEQKRWIKFLEWNDAHNFFKDEDVLGFGDADEIPSRAKLNLLKHCEIPGESIDFGIWFPFGNIHQVFRTDFPIPSHPFTLGDPTFYTFNAAKAVADRESGAYPSRRRGGSSNYLLGGIHMTHYGYLPLQLAKYITATEGGIRSSRDVTHISRYLSGFEIRTMEVAFGATPKQYVSRIEPLNLANPEMAEICVLPWFYNCNRDRYPVWESRHDTRLD